jgi:tRNA/rRNA methyltransferase
VIQVVLVRTEGALNLGSVARLCGNFGAGLRLVGVTADAAAREAVMMAHPAERILAEAPRYATLPEALADVDASIGTSTKIVEARDGPALAVERARTWLPKGGRALALVFGNERTGLALDEAACCTRLVRFLTPGQHESMNLSHAVASALTVLALAQSDVDDAREDTRADPRSRVTLVDEWLHALASVGYFKAHAPESFRPRMQEIVDKMDVSDRDVELLRGMLRVFTKDRA